MAGADAGAARRALRQRLREAHEGESGAGPLVTPCCHDALSARIIAAEGFQAAFVSGFGVAAARGLPDAGLLGLAEVAAEVTHICEAVPRGFPVIADADTGYGNAMNVKRTVRTMWRAGAAALMLEDQVEPKQCGHTEGKQVVSRDEAVAKIRAAVDARRELQGPEEEALVIIARTDARGPLGLEEAIARCEAFRAAGADVTFLEALESEDEMRRYCVGVEGPKMANMLVRGRTPALSARRLHGLGFALIAHPLDVLVRVIASAREALHGLRDLDVVPPQPTEEETEALWELAGFRAYQQESKQYACDEAKALRGAQR